MNCECELNACIAVICVCLCVMMTIEFARPKIYRTLFIVCMRNDELGTINSCDNHLENNQSTRTIYTEDPRLESSHKNSNLFFFNLCLKNHFRFWVWVGQYTSEMILLSIISILIIFVEIEIMNIHIYSIRIRKLYGVIYPEGGYGYIGDAKQYTSCAKHKCSYINSLERNSSFSISKPLCMVREFQEKNELLQISNYHPFQPRTQDSEGEKGMWSETQKMCFRFAWPM